MHRQVSLGLLQPAASLSGSIANEATQERRCQDVATSVAPQPAMLSVVMPVFNEVATIERVVDMIDATVFSHELIIVDDGSTDGTAAVLERLAGRPNVQVFRHTVNQGKGAALKTGFTHVRGDVVIIQDADLEYDPAEYPKMIEPIMNDEADVVYGSRFLKQSEISISRTGHLANSVITWLFNLLARQSVTDVETCYKAFRKRIVDQIASLLVEKRFGCEIECAARVAKLPGVRIVERPISYRARTRQQGKKIGWKDGFRALWCIVRYC